MQLFNSFPGPNSMLYFEPVDVGISLMLLSVSLQFGAFNCSRHKNGKDRTPPTHTRTQDEKNKGRMTSTETGGTTGSPDNGTKSPAKKKTKPLRASREEKIAKGLMVRRQSDFAAMKNLQISDSLNSSDGGKQEFSKEVVCPKADVLNPGKKKVGMVGAHKEKKNKEGRQPARLKTMTCEDSSDDDRIVPVCKKRPNFNDKDGYVNETQLTHITDDDTQLISVGKE
ncbi:hypothetical protein DdX_18709 [Ditylenchus destructor]|uniref:Uncharacterized protein n=1 Tax=Ditylenchus destructor TaxID=166010 RepID=A0AAD4MJ72_9BILA|nr:hypothetical protein DdX_18709 [Ditylenchus destructor]